MEQPVPTFDLGQGYRASPLSFAEYRAACARLESRIFGQNWTYDFGPFCKAAPPLGESFTWGLFHGDELIGWSHSHQSDERTVYMADTGILPEHRGQGLYTRLLPHLLHTFREAGYTLVQSHHRATNNRVIVPKLRAGFVLQGFNVYEGGLNVALTLGLDRAYGQAQHVRSGFRQARGEAAQRLGVRAVAVQEEAGEVPRVRLPALLNVEAMPLGNGYRLWRVPAEVYQEVYSQLEDAAYESVSFDWGPLLALPSPEYHSYTWLIEKDNEVVGWQYSRQWNARTAYMVNTALLPAHRGQGLYRRLLPVVLETLRAEGYTLVRSHHHATNNAVIVPKLRAGFRVQGLEVDEHGVMAVLLYSFDPVYRDYMDVRSGLIRPAGEVALRLGLAAENPD